MRLALKRSTLLQLLSVVVMAFLLIEVVLLLLQNRELRLRIADGQIESPMQGKSAESVVMKTLDDKSVRMAFSESSNGYLLYVLSTSCPHCRNTLPVWQRIAKEEAGSLIQVFGISLNSLELTQTYVLNEHLAFNVLVSDSSFVEKFKIYGVPQTFYIGKDGVIKKVWIGEISEEQRKEIHDLINA